MCVIFKCLKILIVTILRLIFCIVFTFGIIPLIVVFSTPLWIYRQFIIQLAKCFRKDLGKVLSTRSSLMCSNPIYRKPLINITVSCVLEGHVDLEGLRELFYKAKEARLKNGELKYPEIVQNIKYWMGYPFFRNVEGFNINDHVNYYNHDENFSADFETIKKITRDLDFKPFSRKRALWEVHLVPHYKPNPGPRIEEGKHYFMLIFKEHHSLADAFSMFGVLQSLSDKDEKLDMITPHDYTHGLTTTSLLTKLFRGLKIMLKIPWDISSIVTVDKGIFGDIFKTDKNPILETYSPNCVASEASESFIYGDIFKDIKKVHGAGVSGPTSLFAAICGAVRNTFFGQKDKIPKEILLIMPLPLPRPNEKLRNSITFGAILLPIGEKDFIKRLKIIEKRTANMKTSTFPLSVAIFGVMMGAMPRAIIKLALKFRLHLDAVILSNVPGPRKPYDFVGYNCVEIYVSSGLVVGTNLLGVHFASEVGQAKIAVGGDKKIVKNEEKMAEFIGHFMNEFELLRKDPSFEADNA